MRFSFTYICLHSCKPFHYSIRTKIFFRITLLPKKQKKEKRKLKKGQKSAFWYSKRRKEPNNGEEFHLKLQVMIMLITNLTISLASFSPFLFLYTLFIFYSLSDNRIRTPINANSLKREALPIKMYFTHPNKIRNFKLKVEGFYLFQFSSQPLGLSGIYS